MSAPIIALAAGRYKTREEIDVATALGASHVVAGSYTVEKRTGNTGRVLHLFGDGTTANCMGLPNPGLDEFLKHDWSEPVNGTTVVLSISDPQPKTVASMVLSAGSSVSVIEVNLGCPNAEHRVIGMDPHRVRAMMMALRHTAVPIWWKLPPHVDPQLREMIVDALLEYRSPCDALVACNTLPSVTPLGVSGAPVLSHPACGIGGSAVRELALANARDYCRLLSGSGFDVIGCGGVRSRTDVQRYLEVGCAGVQLSSAMWTSSSDIDAFHRLSSW